MSVCGNCGTRRGPFERLHIGNRKTGTTLVLCIHGPLSGEPGDSERHGLGTLACLARRDAQDRARWGTAVRVAA
jgi:hypothetical protein